MYGRTTMGVIRSTFLVDAEGEIEEAQYGVKATGHVGRLLRDLKLWCRRRDWNPHWRGS